MIMCVCLRECEVWKLGQTKITATTNEIKVKCETGKLRFNNKRIKVKEKEINFQLYASNSDSIIFEKELKLSLFVRSV